MEQPNVPMVPERVPPRAVSLPALEWPRELPMPEGEGVAVVLLIGADGLAQVDRCDLPAQACDGIAAALLEAVFEPARIAGEPRPARVSVRFQVRAPKSDAATQGPELAAVESWKAAAEPPREPDYGAVATVERSRPTARSLELAEMREVPGAFGDPFRVIDTLPGVVPVITGLPYVFVRGAPPSATAYFYDGIQMPALFHLALGPAVVHPAMVGPIDFYAGVAPARYGRKTGGVVSGKAARRPLKPGLHGELELRLIDAQMYVAKPLKNGGRIELAGRYGYPGLALKLFEPTAVLQYWDYQLRSMVPISKHSEAVLVALGSFDMVGTRKGLKVERDLELQFHRVEARLTERRTGYSFTTALGAGIERSGLGDNFEVHAFRLGPKLWLDTRVRSAAVRVGADMLATVGKITTPQSDPEPDNRFPVSNNPAYRSASGRNVVGAYAELSMPLAARWDLEAGLRSDVWITGGDAQAAVEPRALVSYRPHERWVVHAAAGLAYQPAVFLIPLPGVSDVALDRGLQRAVQTELGARVELPYDLSVQSKAFVHFYDNMLLFERPERRDCGESVENCEPETYARFSARTYGSEWLLRRNAKQRVSGWLSYTLAKSEGETDRGRRLTPTFDIRHVGSLVFQWRISATWHVAVRGYGQSGRFPLNASTEIDPRKRQRLPPFARGDLQLSRLWARPWGELRFTLDWLNFTFQRDPSGWDCGDSPPGASDKCAVEYVNFPITLPMLGVRGSY